jgi:hypothetical protein
MRQCSALLPMTTGTCTEVSAPAPSTTRECSLEPGQLDNVVSQLSTPFPFLVYFVRDPGILMAMPCTVLYIYGSYWSWVCDILEFDLERHSPAVFEWATGITISIWVKTRSLSIFTKTTKIRKKLVSFWYKNQNLKFGENPKNRVVFLVYRPVFLIYRSVLADFLFKIQILNEKGKSLGFTGLLLSFSGLSLGFSFFFQIF